MAKDNEAEFWKVMDGVNNQGMSKKGRERAAKQAKATKRDQAALKKGAQEARELLKQAEKERNKRNNK